MKAKLLILFILIVLIGCQQAQKPTKPFVIIQESTGACFGEGNSLFRYVDYFGNTYTTCGKQGQYKLGEIIN